MCTWMCACVRMSLYVYANTYRCTGMTVQVCVCVHMYVYIEHTLIPVPLAPCGGGGARPTRCLEHSRSAGRLAQAKQTS